MDFLKFISVLLYVIFNMKKVACMYTYKDNHMINKRDIFISPTRSWNTTIKYQIKPGLKNNTIKEALEELENNTCFKFIETDLSNNNTSGIIFQLSTICYSIVGLASLNSPQVINLTFLCSANKGMVLHELGHALGLEHEQSRTDRDKYIIIDHDNLKKEGKDNFDISSERYCTNFSTYYDFASIMHYKSNDFAIYKQKAVIKSKIHNLYDRMMGQREGMTFNDYKIINLAYCDKYNFYKGKKKKDRKRRNKREGKENQNKTGCRYGGYPHYNNCSECICPFGYTGPTCRNIVKSDESCGNTTFNATEEIFYHGLLGDKKCFIFLKAKKNTRINVGIYYSNARSQEICTQSVGHQLKFMKDKGTTGLLICSWYRDIINITSESNSVLLFYNGQDSNHFIQFGFRQV